MKNIIKNTVVYLLLVIGAACLAYGIYSVDEKLMIQGLYCTLLSTFFAYILGII